MNHMELLRNKSTADLLNLMREKGLGFPVEADDNDIREILKIYGDRSGFDVSWHLSLLDEEEPDWTEYQDMSDKEIRMLKEHHNDRLKLAHIIKKIEEKRDEMCAKLASAIHGAEDVASKYDRFPDDSIDVMRKACEMMKDGVESVSLNVDLKADEKKGADLLEEGGYCFCERVHAYDSGDEYEHIRTVIFPAEVLLTFQEIDNPINEEKRKIKRAVADSCSVAAKYYDEATMAMAYRIYEIWILAFKKRFFRS